MASDSDSGAEFQSPIKADAMKHSFPIHTNDIAASKSSFQQMLMKFNNVSNDSTNIFRAASATPGKGILKNVKIERPRESMDVFNPTASSTLFDSSKLCLSNTFDVAKKRNNSSSFEGTHETSPLRANKFKRSERERFGEPSGSFEAQTKGHKKKRTSESFEKPPENHTGESYEDVNVPKKLKRKRTSTETHPFNITNAIEAPLSAKKPKLDVIASPGTSEKLDLLLDKFENATRYERSNDTPHFSKDITADRYETFILQVPKNFDVKALTGLQLSLSNKSRVKSNGVKYDWIPTPREQPATLLNNNHLVTVHPKASVVIQQHIKKKHVPELSGTLHNGIAFPTDLKIRHPLFGADYENLSQIEEHVRRKLRAACELYAVRNKVVKKMKSKQHETVSPSQPQEEEIFKWLNQSIEEVNKKHKKAKGREDEALKSNAVLFTRDAETSGSGKKKKKHKKLVSP